MRCKSDVRAIALLLFLPAFAVAAPAPCTAPEYRQFDFWVGHWTVRDAGGEMAGSNRISLEERGCVLIEAWQGAQGGTGRSYNYFDPAAGMWRQNWISPGVLIDIAGGMVGGSMALEGHIVYTAKAQRRPFRGTWTALPDGRVRQFFEEKRGDEGWQPWFEGFYEKSRVDKGE